LLAPEAADRAVLKLQGAALKPAFLGRSGRWKLLRLLLLVLLLAGIYFVYGEAIRTVLRNLQSQANVSIAPARHRSDGTPKSERELWEDGLICAYSEDTGRCACYERQGAKARISQQRCQELAERGSVLQQ
jgi:hypothetical protein